MVRKLRKDNFKSWCANEKCHWTTSTITHILPHKELVDALIDKVYVFPDKRIEIVWKIADFTVF